MFRPKVLIKGVVLLASVADTLAPLPSTPSDAPSPAGEEGAATLSPNSNSNQWDAPAHESILDGTDGNAARPITPMDAVEVAAPLADPPPRGTKKRKRGRQSKDQKMDSVFAASEGVRVVAKLVLAATKRLTVN